MTANKSVAAWVVTKARSRRRRGDDVETGSREPKRGRRGLIRCRSAERRQRRRRLDALRGTRFRENGARARERVAHGSGHVRSQERVERVSQTRVAQRLEQREGAVRVARVFIRRVEDRRKRARSVETRPRP